jgi:hypothetical protein
MIDWFALDQRNARMRDPEFSNSSHQSTLHLIPLAPLRSMPTAAQNESTRVDCHRYPAVVSLVQ